MKKVIVLLALVLAACSKSGGIPTPAPEPACYFENWTMNGTVSQVEICPK